MIDARTSHLRPTEHELSVSRAPPLAHVSLGHRYRLGQVGLQHDTRSFNPRARLPASGIRRQLLPNTSCFPFTNSIRCGSTLLMRGASFIIGVKSEVVVRNPSLARSM
jgi:hypothetical protein